MLHTMIKRLPTDVLLSTHMTVMCDPIYIDIVLTGQLHTNQPSLTCLVCDSLCVDKDIPFQYF